MRFAADLRRESALATSGLVCYSSGASWGGRMEGFMAFDVSKVVSELGEDLIASVGEPLGLDRDLSLKAAHALAANWGKGQDEAVKAAAAETGVGEEVMAAMLGKVVDAGKDKAIDAAKDKAGEAVEAAKVQAMAALEASPVGKAAGGFLGKLFGKK